MNKTKGKQLLFQMNCNEEHSVYIYPYSHMQVRLKAAMQYICDYESSSSSSSYDNQILDSREVRQVYLVTYSQADTSLFPTRQSFAEAIVKSFTTSTTSVVQWCCSKESHERSGWHYHVAIKLNKTKCWLPSKKYLLEKYGVSVRVSQSVRRTRRSFSHTVLPL